MYNSQENKKASREMLISQAEMDWEWQMGIRVPWGITGNAGIENATVQENRETPETQPPPCIQEEVTQDRINDGRKGSTAKRSTNNKGLEVVNPRRVSTRLKFPSLKALERMGRKK